MDTKESDAANELWRQHAEDEAVALRAQQAGAGETHHPVEGPPPHGNEKVNLIAAEIVRQERERCARVVETWPVGGDSSASELLSRVAAQLRRLA